MQAFPNNHCTLQHACAREACSLSACAREARSLHCQRWVLLEYLHFLSNCARQRNHSSIWRCEGSAYSPNSDKQLCVQTPRPVCYSCMCMQGEVCAGHCPRTDVTSRAVEFHKARRGLHLPSHNHSVLPLQTIFQVLFMHSCRKYLQNRIAKLIFSLKIKSFLTLTACPVIKRHTDLRNSGYPCGSPPVPPG